MDFRNLKIGLRAGLGFAVLTVLSLILGGVALYQMKRMDAMAQQVDQNWLPAIVTVNELNTATSRVRALTLSMLALRGNTALKSTSDRIDEIKRQVKDAEARYQSLISTETERVAFAEFQAALSRYLEQQQLVQSKMLQGARAEAIDIINTKLNDLASELTREMLDLTEINKAGAQRATQESDRVFAQAITLIAATMAVTAALTLAIALLLTRSIVRPLAQAVDVARTVASGDLTHRIQVTGSDEPAQLLHALREMQQNLRDTLQRIADSSTQLASASEELHAVTEDSTRGLHRQNTEIEQAATAVNEMTAAVEEVARNAVTTSEASRHTDRTAQDGRDRVRQTVESISQLANDVTVTSEEVGQLAVEVRNISQVLNVIRAIAEQTNLLALNAAIEAARAGEQGRGFAVVADEVRALAHRTQQSTAEIEQMINGIQQGTEKAVGAMQNSMGRAQSTLQVAQAAGEALEDITRAIAEINERNLVIASASEEQAQVAREVDRNLVNIRDLAVQTSAGADQTSASSQELSRLAVDLNGLVAKFSV
ncbi:methyl-accepting chemotaxis protein [Metapseudomonas furukawaii]